MELYVIRHGVAEDAGSGSDDARVLSEKGKTRTDAVARALAVLEWKPGLILHSPLIRARQTARILARHASGTLAVSACAALAPGVDIAQMCAVLQKLDTDCVAVVGHMPHLERLVSALVTGDNRLSVALKKAGVCRVDFSGPVLAGHGVLSWLLQPRHLLAIAAEH